MTTRSRSLPAVAALLLLAGCGGGWGELQRLDLTRPGPTAVELDAMRAFEAAEGRVNTYRRWLNGKEDGLTSRTLLVAPENPEQWLGFDNRTGWVDFVLVPDRGIAIAGAHSERFNRSVIVDEPVLLAPRAMPQEQRFDSTTTFRARRDGKESTGELRFATWFAGFDDAETELGLLERCVRVDSEGALDIGFGLTVAFRLRQWLHPDYGEVVRDADGSARFAGVPLREFTARQVIVGSERATDAQRLELLERTRVLPGGS
jgi:hypothetical protein